MKQFIMNHICKSVYYNNISNTMMNYIGRYTSLQWYLYVPNICYHTEGSLVTKNNDKTKILMFEI